MSRLKGVFSWRLLFFVAGLFLLSLLAPFGWNRNSEPAARHLGKSSRGEDASRLESELAQSAAGEESEIQDPNSEIAPSPQLAPLGPLVADQIDLDPSITQTPALPAQGKLDLTPEIGPIPADDS